VRSADREFAEMNLLRRQRPPGDVLDILAKGERVASWADAADGTVVVATPLGLWWPFDAGMRRIGWSYISKAAWNGNVLSVVEADVEDDLIRDHPAVAVRLATPRDLPLVVRKRVNANIVKTELVSVDGGAVRFVGRRLPGADGIAWWARLEPGTLATDELHSAVHARLQILRAQKDDPTG
jgi:hypothetical protein